MTTDWNKILNWKLLPGSHKFPGPDGGTCINEAALVVAGFNYQSVGSVDSLPPCFSRPLSAFALGLNDSMPDGLRQELLMPFVVRLAGTADTSEVERTRAQLIVLRVITGILPSFLDLIGYESFAARCRKLNTLVYADALIKELIQERQYVSSADVSEAYTSGMLTFVKGAIVMLAGENRHRCEAVGLIGQAAERIMNVFDVDLDLSVNISLWKKAVAILDGALKIGNQAEPIETGLVVSRLEQAKQQSEERV